MRAYYKHLENQRNQHRNHSYSMWAAWWKNQTDLVILGKCKQIHAAHSVEKSQVHFHGGLLQIRK